MNLANVHIVPSVMNMNKESPGNSPQPSDDEDDEPSNLWGSDYNAQNIDAPPSRNAVKQISKSLSKEQRKVHAKRKSVVGGQLSTNNYVAVRFCVDRFYRVGGLQEAKGQG